MKVKSLSRALLIATPWTAVYQAPPSMGVSRQEYWSGLPLTSPEETSSLSNSIVFLYFFALITEEGFLISPCSSLELCFWNSGYIFPFLLCLLLFLAICKASSDNHFAFLHFFFLGMVLITPSYTMSQTSAHGIFQARVLEWGAIAFSGTSD